MLEKGECDKFHMAIGPSPIYQSAMASTTATTYDGKRILANRYRIDDNLGQGSFSKRFVEFITF